MSVERVPGPSVDPASVTQPEEALILEEEIEETTTPEEDHDRILESFQGLPWWKRPSPTWLLCSVPFSGIAMAATIAPKLEVLTEMACATHRPEVFTFTPQDCAGDSAVQAAVGEIAAVLLMTGGLLSCLTTGWWGSFSDRHGRIVVLGLAVFGVLQQDILFVVIAYFFGEVRHGYWLLVIPTALDGLLGGATTSHAAGHAYLADTTPTALRTRTFTLSGGLLLVGVALGPTVGGLLVHFTGRAILVFVFSAALVLLYGLYVWFIIPESLTKEKMRKAKDIYNASLISRPNTTRAVGFFSTLKPLFSFLSPLGVFSPSIPSKSPVGKARKTDWNLPIMAVCYSLVLLAGGSVFSQFQYAQKAFGWNSEIIAYWISLLSLSRATYLTIVLPLLIKLLRPKPAPKPTTESNTTSEGAETDPLIPSSSVSDQHRGVVFDLRLARVTLLLDLIPIALMGITNHARSFMAFGLISSIGAGFTPTMHNVFLELYTQRGGIEKGKLFGALSVLQALNTQILGPPFFGMIYILTVSIFPRTIFFVVAGTLGTSLALLMLVSLRHPKRVSADEADIDSR